MIPHRKRNDHCHGFAADLGRAAACRLSRNHRANIGYVTNEFVIRSHPRDYGAQYLGVGSTAPRCGCSRADGSRFLTSVLVAFVGGLSCVQYSADHSRVRGRSTGSSRALFRKWNNPNRNNARSRTEMSARSTAAASISATSPAWHGRSRPNRTSHSLPASIRAPRAAGSPTITNHPQKCSASFSPRS